MSTLETKKQEYVSSEHFQANYGSKTDYMDRQIGSSIKHNPDLPAIIAIKAGARTTLPYGRWTCDDDSMVIFNRNYQPLFKIADGKKSFITADTLIMNIYKVEYFYGDHNTPVLYLLRKFKEMGVDAKTRNASRKSLAICLSILEDNYPENPLYLKSWSPFTIGRGFH